MNYQRILQIFSYTASALSFMLEHLGKTVIVTGSQIPLFESRSDGRDNFLGALILAGGQDLGAIIRNMAITNLICISLISIALCNF